ncbi:peptidoglycan-binding protein [Pedobacter sp. MC2016-14]|uniref:peptidoglycan-binding protein n=1 Tax=Pedobacter sp. MC2016-14 TaxID=2897327 RepID=UPI001E391DAF|nr:peptidoglycan-binding protein [Pedobacter sp. MC2016-14]MCD0489791.1 peptidoglycan-binding protein [Pedobacter sp. MC2016-14]
MLDIIPLATGEIGVRELTGNNDGKRVEEYLRCVGLKKGNPWCAAWISFVFMKAGYTLPRTGWSPALFRKGKLTREPKRGVVFGLYFPDKKRIAHCGILERVHGSHLYTIEGNTDASGSNEGDGVYRRLRNLKHVRHFAEWR